MVKENTKQFFAWSLMMFFIALFSFSSYLYFTKNEEDNDIVNDIQENIVLPVNAKSVEICNDVNVYEEALISKKIEIDNYIKTTYPNSSVMYYDLNSELTYKYNEEEVYYGASLIKTLVALYIYEEALINPLILEKQVVYKSIYKTDRSLGLDKYKIGDKVRIRDLVKYSISVSDNSAHFMLLDYICFNELKQFGILVGNKHTLIGGDKYGDIDLHGAYIYMKRLNDYINNNLELGNELKGYFINSYYNSLQFEDINFLHKYGNFEMFFHDIGISKTKEPYILIILTKYGNKEKEKIINDISKKIYEFHNDLKQIKKEECIE